MYKNTEHIVRITDFGNDGEGIAKIDGFTVFVPSAVKGDLARILIVKEKKHFGYGKLLEVIEPSKIRTEPQCSVFGKCGGCSMQSVSYDAQLEYKKSKVLEALRRIGGFKDAKINSVTGSDPCYYYRNKAQFPVLYTAEGVKSGFYAPHSHRVVSTEECPLQDKRSNALCKAVTTWASENAVPVFDEASGKGLLRRICMRAAKDEAVLILVTAKPLPHLCKLTERINAEFPYVKGIVQNFNADATNSIYGKNDEVIFGVPYIFDNIGDIKYKIHYKSFYQVNPCTTKPLYEKALELCDCDKTKSVFDLYCGTGTISLFLAQSAKSVIGIEIIPDAVKNAKENAALNNIDNAVFYCGEAETVAPKLIKSGIRADAVVLDPPRKGCDEKLICAIGEMKPDKVIYVSCDCATMARDMKRLSEYGYTLDEVHVFDQFPQTSHTECVVRLCLNTHS
ncbi:MAG: 23S rRNA (uracil(1939)-C(5))-methyltransferase RlmD [Clostridia bacterium]|nr:23S rRNA (uracil(1939)-C(5))-methyltransferase RlmD [Clostridia bacterium]